MMKATGEKYSLFNILLAIFVNNSVEQFGSFISLQMQL